MPALNSLVNQQGNAEPPNVQGSSGTDQASGLQGLMREGGVPQGPGMQPPSHQETTAILQHLSYFRQRWASILKDPEIGTKNVRSEVYDMYADALADDYGTLPQIMGTLKSLPTNPLEQKQWLESKVQQVDKAKRGVLDHYLATAPPPGSFQEEMAKAGPPGDRASLVRGAISRYKANPRRPSRHKGIPLNG